MKNINFLFDLNHSSTLYFLCYSSFNFLVYSLVMPDIRIHSVFLALVFAFNIWIWLRLKDAPVELLWILKIVSFVMASSLTIVNIFLAVEAISKN